MQRRTKILVLAMIAAFVIVWTTTGCADGRLSPQGGTITGVNTSSSSGLQGGGNHGPINLSLRQDCDTDQVLAWSGSDWICASASGVGVEAGNGLESSGTDPVIFKIRQDCEPGDTLRWMDPDSEGPQPYQWRCWPWPV